MIRKTFKDCTITTRLNNETLTEKLTIICSALNLRFTEENAVIKIKGEGCAANNPDGSEPPG